MNYKKPALLAGLLLMSYRWDYQILQPHYLPSTIHTPSSKRKSLSDIVGIQAVVLL
jgi:hypothetical protein